MKIKKSYYFHPEREKGNDVDGRLRMRVTFGGKRFHYSLGMRVDFDKWDGEAQFCKPNTTHSIYKIHATEINSEIIELTKLADIIFKTFEVEEKIPTMNEFKEKFHEANNSRLGVEKIQVKKEKTVTFYNVFDEFVKEEGRQNNWTVATKNKFGTVKNHLLKFDEKLVFEDLNHAKLNDYKDFLSEERELRDLTVNKQIKFLKWFLNWATNNGFNNKTDYNSYKPKLKGSDSKVIFLTVAEVNVLESMEIPDKKNYLDRVRDVFLFQCYTSLRYSDVKNLKRWNIKENHIELTTQKTFDFLTINLNRRSKEILEKYKEFHFEDGLVLPVISNQKMNKYLKELCEIAGFNELIDKPYFKGGVRYSDIKPKYEWLGSHTARRTFISNALANGMPPHIVMEFTGHSDYKAMEPYIDVTEETKTKHMDLYMNSYNTTEVETKNTVKQ